MLFDLMRDILLSWHLPKLLVLINGNLFQCHIFYSLFLRTIHEAIRVTAKNCMRSKIIQMYADLAQGKNNGIIPFVKSCNGHQNIVTNLTHWSASIHALLEIFWKAKSIYWLEKTRHLRDFMANDWRKLLFRVSQIKIKWRKFTIFNGSYATGTMDFVMPLTARGMNWSGKLCPRKTSFTEWKI